MIDTASLVARVDAVLASTIAGHRARWIAVEPDLSVVFDEVNRLVFSGGKRLRPQFCHWGWIAAGGEESSPVPDSLGAAIELLHVTALFHDDVIDDAATRRGQATTHRRMSQIHVDHRWAGESRRFGEGVAVLIGDVTFVMSDSVIGDVSPEARVIWHDLRMEMNIGQYLDTLGSARRERQLEAADLVCRYKSAKYTIERPLHLGAVAAEVGRGAALMSMFSEYGLPLGEAFQMRDDLLGAFGDPDVTGKPVGGDFREGKPTPMLARAFQMASRAQQSVLESVGDPELDEETVRRIQDVVVETGAVREMEQLITTLRDEAINALDSTAMAGDSHEALVELADSVTRRDS